MSETIYGRKWNKAHLCINLLIIREQHPPNDHQPVVISSLAHMISSDLLFFRDLFFLQMKAVEMVLVHYLKELPCQDMQK